MGNLKRKKGENGKYGFVDDAGSWVIEPKFDSASSFKYGIAKVKVNKRYGFIKLDGSYLYEPEFLDAFIWGELGVAHFDKDEEGNECDGWAYFNCKEPLKYITENGWFDYICKPEDRYADYLEAWNEAGNDWHHISKDGKRLDLNDLEEEDDDEISYTQHGIIDRTGAWIVEPKFDNAGDFSDGAASVEIDGKYGFIDKTGAWIIEPNFDYAERFSDGTAQVKIDGKYGFIDKAGEWVVEPMFDDVNNFSDGTAIVEMAVKKLK